MKNDENPLILKEFQPMDTLFNSRSRFPSSNAAKTSSSPLNLRILGHSLSLAEDIGALEECLALERTAHGNPEAIQNTGIFSPPAVPYCEFLMLRDGFGKLLAVSRLMRLGGKNPVLSPLESGRFHLSPLLTALRYSREGVVEMGAPVFLPGRDHARAAKLLWRGLIHYMEKRNLGFVVGSDVLPKLETDKEALPRLMDSHGLHPDLEVEARPQFRRASIESWPERFGTVDGVYRGPTPPDKLPPGLNEALLRGCRLAAEPVFNQATGRWEFIWVSFREMLVDGASG